MDNQLAAEMIDAWTMLSNLALIGLLMSVALIATLDPLRRVQAPIRIRSR